jgi:hypothetical protein
MTRLQEMGDARREHDRDRSIGQRPGLVGVSVRQSRPATVDGPEPSTEHIEHARGAIDPNVTDDFGQVLSDLPGPGTELNEQIIPSWSRKLEDGLGDRPRGV